jgi:hypothetical protein
MFIDIFSFLFVFEKTCGFHFLISFNIPPKVLNLEIII